MLCASPKYIKQYGVPKKPKDLASHYGVIFCKADVPVSWRLFPKRGAEAPRGFLPKGRMHLSSVMAIHQAAKEGLGIADLPLYLVEEDFKHRRLVPVLRNYIDSPRHVWALYPGSRALPRKLKIFVERLVEHFAVNFQRVRP